MSEIREQAVQYAAGLLDAAGRDAFEALLAAGDPVAMAEVESALSTVESVVGAAPVYTPRPHVKSRLMAAAAASKPKGFQEAWEGVTVLRQGEGKWRETGYPGAKVQILHLDKETRMSTSILKLEPGAVYPPHHHTAVEQCLVLSGDVRFGNKLQIFAGDFEKAEMGTDHESLTSDTGCELLIISCLDDEIHLAPA
ncbi:MAG: hypothetical protein FJW32_22030 [Acidobacteria bacterium]|nr:hypothetical protein [Acidobacteriota bacterium]